MIRRGNKYHARRTEYRGEWYDSASEATYAATLELQKKAGQITRWERGAPQVLIEGPTRSERITYKPDFIVYLLDGTSEAVDVKGVVTREFRIKAILWARKFPNIPLRVVDGRGNVKWPKRRAA